MESQHHASHHWLVLGEKEQVLAENYKNFSNPGA